MIFTQSAFLLLSRPATLDQIQERLEGKYEILGRTEGDPDTFWAFGSPALVLQLGDELEGRLIIDAVEERWADDAGDPEGNPGLFAAWNLGAFGPGAAPGCLERAGQQAWAWKQASAAVRGHRALIRLRTTWVTEDEEQPLPEDYDPRKELLLLTQVASEIAELREVMCWFNPNGESLRPPGFVREALDHHLTDDEWPLDVWTNVRVSKLPIEGDWMLMDTVGMPQIRRPDVEILFPQGRFALEQVDRFARDLCAYLVEAGNVLDDGHTVDGPDETTWMVLKIAHPLGEPDRPVLRFVPAGVDVPTALLARGSHNGSGAA